MNTKQTDKLFAAMKTGDAAEMCRPIETTFSMTRVEIPSLTASAGGLPSAEIFWPQVIADVNRTHSYSAISQRCHMSKGWVAEVKKGTQPGFQAGIRLLELWCVVTRLPPDQAPTEPADRLLRNQLHI